MYRLAGNRGLAAGDESGDEQPLEAVALLEAHVAAKAVTGEAMHAASANRCLAWFLGENVLATPLADSSSGACLDGLGPRPNAKLRRGVDARVASSRARASRARRPPSPAPSRVDAPGSRLGLAERVGFRRAVQALGPSGSGSGGAGTGGGTSPGAGSGSGCGGAGTGSGSAGGGCTSGCDGSGTLTRAPRSVPAPPNEWGGSPRAGPHHRRPSGPNRATDRCADPRAARRMRRRRQGRRSR